MKKYLNRKCYDTTTAKQIWHYEYRSSNYKESYSETLYQKRTKEFFLYCIGNSESPYGNSFYRNEVECGMYIIPISYNEARVWLEEHGTVNIYMGLFDATT